MPGGGGVNFWNGGADVLTWGTPNCLGSEVSRYQKYYMSSEICGRPDFFGVWYFMVQGTFLVPSFFGTG